MTAVSGANVGKEEYLEQRKNKQYYKALQTIIDGVGKNCASLLDVGSRGVDLISHLPAAKKVSIDMLYPLEAEGVISVKGDFFAYEPEQRFDLVCCFQVLEHIENARAFAQKLLACGKNVIVSVPYMWWHEAYGGHKQDPVYEDKLLSWFDRPYDFSLIVRDAYEARLIACYFENNMQFVKQFVDNSVTLYDMSETSPEQETMLLALKNRHECLIKKYDDWQRYARFSKQEYTQNDINAIVKLIEKGLLSQDEELKRKVLEKLANLRQK